MQIFQVSNDPDDEEEDGAEEKTIGGLVGQKGMKSNYGGK